MKLIKFISALFFLSFTCISLFSCSNNPVTPVKADTTIDSARYNWTEYTASNLTNKPGVWARDTNNIFFNNGGYLHFYNGVFTQYSSEDFHVDFLTGGDKNTAYLIGHTAKANDSLVRIKKWNGSTFTEIPVINNNVPAIRTCFFNKPDEIWMTTSDNKICKFNGSALIFYPFYYSVVDTCSIEKIYFDSTAQKLRAFASTKNSPGTGLFYVYDFNGFSWDKTADIQFHDGGYLYFVNGYIMSVQGNDMIFLNNSGFGHITSTAGFEFTYGMGGSSKDNILVWGRADFNQGLYNWNGSRWSREITPGYPGNTVTPINERSFVISGGNKIIIGIKK